MSFTIYRENIIAGINKVFFYRHELSLRINSHIMVLVTSYTHTPVVSHSGRYIIIKLDSTGTINVSWMHIWCVEVLITSRINNISSINCLVGFIVATMKVVCIVCTFLMTKCSNFIWSLHVPFFFLHIASLHMRPSMFYELLWAVTPGVSTGALVDSSKLMNVISRKFKKSSDYCSRVSDNLLNMMWFGR